MRIWKYGVVSCLLLAGCAAGVNFTKPDDGQLVVGKTTESDVITTLGKPNIKGAKVVNGESLNTDTYAYAKVGGTAALPGVTPARSLALVFRNGVLVEKAYSSSFAADSTYFDVTKAKTVKPGMTVSEVESLLGKPSGEAIFPKRLREYVFTETKGFKSQHNLLTVETDDNGNVVNAYYNQVGQL
nr:outer membrane protein assembly factor BamE [Rhodanobacter sp. T12-5]